MAVLVTDSRNASYAGTLATANGLIKADTSSLLATGSRLALSTVRTIAFTPTTGYNNNGVILWLSTGTTAAANDRSVYVSLQQIMGTCTVNAGTDEVTFTSHGFSDGQGVMITAATTQPGGITVNTIYYARVTGSSAPTNTFFLYATAAQAIAGGPTGLVNITSTGSGTLTLYAERGSETRTASTICNGRTTSATTIYAVYIEAFKWTAYAVTAASGTWRYFINQTGGTTGAWQVGTSDGTNLTYVALGDIQATYADNTDQVVFMDQCDLSDGSYQFKRQSASVQICAVVCKSPSIPTKTNNVATMFVSAPAAARTYKIDGYVVVSGDGAFQIGTSAAKVTSFTNKVTVDFNYISAGTATSRFTDTVFGGSPYYGWKQNIIVYGTQCTNQGATLNATANTGATVCYTDSNISSWAASSRLMIGKQNNTTTGSTAFNTVSAVTAPSWSGSQTTLTLGEAIATYNRLGPSGGEDGGKIVNIDGYTVIWKGGSTSSGGTTFYGSGNFYYEGVLFQDCVITGQTNAAEENDAGFQEMLDCTAIQVSNPTYTFFFAAPAPCYQSTAADINPTTITRVNFINTAVGQIASSASPFAAAQWSYIYSVNCGAAAGAMLLNAKGSVSNSRFENSGVGAIIVNNMNCSITDCTFYGLAYAYSGGAIQIANSATASVTTSGNRFNRCGTPVKVTSFSGEWDSEDDTWGNETVNTTADISTGNTTAANGIGVGTIKIDMRTPTFTTSPSPSISSDILNYATTGSYMRIVDYGGTLNDCRSWYKEGYFSSVSPSYASILAKTITSYRTLTNTYTYNSRSITSVKMAVNVNCQIANAAYYAGTYTAPTLEVYADGDAVTPAGSDAASASTSAQTLSVITTPTTNNNDVVVKLKQKTDATEANSGVTWDSLGITLRALGYSEGAYSTTLRQTTDAVQGVLATLTTDPYWSVTTEGTLAAYSEFTINHATQTVTITADTTLQRLYDYAQYDLWLDANMGYAKWFSTLDGVNFTSTYDIVLNTGVDLTGGGSIEMETGTTFTRTGTATYDGYVINADGTRTVHIKLNGLVASSVVQIYNTTNSAEIDKTTVTGTTYDYYYTYSADKNIRIRVRNVIGTTGYIPYEATGTITNTGFTLNVSQESAAVYNDNNLDGSTPTEFSLTEGVIKVYIDDPDNITTFQRLYNWYLYSISTSTYIDDQTDLITANSTRDYIFDDTLAIKNLDGSNPLYIYGANVRNESSDNAIIDATGGSIFIRGDYPAASVGEIWGDATSYSSGTKGQQLKDASKAKLLL